MGRTGKVRPAFGFARGGAQAQSGARTAPALTHPPARARLRAEKGPAAWPIQRQGKQSEDGSKGETDAGNRKPENRTKYPDHRTGTAAAGSARPQNTNPAHDKT